MLLHDLVARLDTLLDIRSCDAIDGAVNGLQVARNNTPITSCAVAVDACMASFQRAVDAGAQLLIVHHGIQWGKQQPLVGAHFERVRFLVDNGLALYAAHLPLDIHATLGNNIAICEGLGLHEVAPFGSYKGVAMGYGGELQQPLTMQQISKLFMERQMECGCEGQHGWQTHHTTGGHAACAHNQRNGATGGEASGTVNGSDGATGGAAHGRNGVTSGSVHERELQQSHIGSVTLQSSGATLRTSGAMPEASGAMPHIARDTTSGGVEETGKQTEGDMAHGRELQQNHIGSVTLQSSGATLRTSGAMPHIAHDTTSGGVEETGKQTEGDMAHGRELQQNHIGSVTLQSSGATLRTSGAMPHIAHDTTSGGVEETGKQTEGDMAPCRLGGGIIEPLGLLPFGVEQCRRVAVVSGGGGFALDEAIASNYDVLITGDASYPAYYAAYEAKINVLFAGHYATETWGVKRVAAWLNTQGVHTMFIDLPTGL